MLTKKIMSHFIEELGHSVRTEIFDKRHGDFMVQDEDQYFLVRNNGHFQC